MSDKSVRELREARIAALTELLGLLREAESVIRLRIADREDELQRHQRLLVTEQASNREETPVGSRANIAVRFGSDVADKEAVFLYTHWNGYMLPGVLASALDSNEARARWNDPPYLARIVFEHMIRGASDFETGFGISTRIGDNEYPLLVLYTGNVYALSEEEYNARGFERLLDYPWVSFEEFCTLRPSWEQIDQALQMPSTIREQVDEEMARLRSIS